MIRLWADIVNPNTNAKYNPGPVTLLTASTSRELDGPGQVSFNTTAMDQHASTRAFDLLQPKRHAYIYVEERGTPRLLTICIIDEVALRPSGEEYTLSVTGPDLLMQLAYKNTLLGRIYDDDPIADVVSGLASLATGWASTVADGLGNISVRFDGSSVLKSLQAVAEQTGNHLRLGDGATVEFGPMGDELSVVAIRPSTPTQTVITNSDVILIQSIEIVDEARDVTNWIMPIGAGQGDAALTLAKSTRSGISSTTGPDGRTIYYIEDAGSIADYGQIERRVDIKRIAPTGTSDTAIANAANQLYDAAYAWLQRNKQPVTRYRISCAKIDTTIRPGDKLRVIYQGEVNRNGITARLVDLNETFWVLSVTERVATGGTSLDLDLCNVDQYRNDTEQILVGAVDSINVTNIGYAPTFNMYVWGPFQDLINSSNNVTFKLRIPDQTLDISLVKLVVTTRPFATTATGAASGGSSAPTSSSGGYHRHRIATPAGTTGSSAATGFVMYGNTTLMNVNLDRWTGTAATDLYTEDVDNSHTHTVTIPAHTHALVYGVNRDTDYPDTLGITVNGVSVASGLDSGGTGLDQHEIDITDEILGKAGGFRGNHTIVVSAAGGQGMVEVQFIVYDTVIQGRAT